MDQKNFGKQRRTGRRGSLFGNASRRGRSLSQSGRSNHDELSRSGRSDEPEFTPRRGRRMSLFGNKERQHEETYPQENARQERRGSLGSRFPERRPRRGSFGRRGATGGGKGRRRSSMGWFSSKNTESDDLGDQVIKAFMDFEE